MCCRLQKGFTLAEVLASVFLLALGIIGAAGMQLQALRTAQQSGFRTAALLLATEMADVMRMTLSTSDSQTLLKPYLEVDFRSSVHSASPAPNCYFLSCTAEQFVKFNVEEWKQRIENTLPEGRAKICLDAQASSDDTGQPDWTCSVPASGAVQKAGPIVIKIGWREKTHTATAHDKPAGLPEEPPPLLVLTVAPYVQ
jgi:type IV pilus assembly protein PilV